MEFDMDFYLKSRDMNTRSIVFPHGTYGKTRWHAMFLQRERGGGQTVSSSVGWRDRMLAFFSRVASTMLAFNSKPMRRVWEFI